ncbi:hypothetical protein GOBAR_DD15708 [Gossypium barbadense]|nr:hypothetical protein GOBAR_DD15708 [Gossypium barbadense]
MGGVAWTEEEDYLLKKCIERYGEGKWHRIPVLAGKFILSFFYDQTAAATTTASMKPRRPAHVSPNTQQETSVWAPFHDVQVNQQGQEVAAEEPGTLVGDLEFDEGGSSKWWDDFIFDMDLWTASL